MVFVCLEDSTVKTLKRFHVKLNNWAKSRNPELVGKKNIIFRSLVLMENTSEGI